MNVNVNAAKSTACETAQEWMSLAQDGLLGSIESRRLHEHLASCPECQAQWEGMMCISRLFHAAPMLGPEYGFALRLQARIAYQEEQRRHALVVILLAVGAMALFFLALPSLVSLLGLTGELLLPYWLIAYIQGAWNWLSIALNSLSSAGWLILINFVSTSRGIACLTSVAILAAVFVLWVPLMMRRMVTRAVKVEE